MKTFLIYEAAGSQTRSVAACSSPSHANLAVKGLANGDYTVRDCLGGLRLRIRKDDAGVKVLERTK